MANPIFSSTAIATPVGNAILLSVEIPGGVTTPAEFAASVGGFRMKVPPEHGVIVSGRLPIWAAGMLFHHFHPTSWVASYDPRLGGAVVTQRHTATVELGQVIPMETGEAAV